MSRNVKKNRREAERLLEAIQDAERIAQAFHAAYEELAPLHGWVTQAASHTMWSDVPPENRNLMVAVVQRLLKQDVIRVGIRPAIPERPIPGQFDIEGEEEPHAPSPV